VGLRWTAADKRTVTVGENVDVSHRERPVLIFDGDCAFCTKCVHVVERIGPDAEIVPWQFADLAELGITEEQAAEAVQWVQIDGTVRSGHEAIAGVLSTAGRIWKTIGRVLLLPGTSWLAAKAYQLVARNRYRLPGSTPACALPPVQATGESTKSG
jgi:predicted DCC family thiol-disulfide oxidoreductase YuxK